MSRGGVSKREVNIIPGTEEAVFRGPFQTRVHVDDFVDMRPATKVGNHIIFSDGAGRKLTWRERLAWRLGRLQEVSRKAAKIESI